MTETLSNQDIASTFDRPFYAGGQTTNDVPGRAMVALAGRSYLLDLSFPPDAFKHESIPLIRRTFDTVSRPGEGAINPDDLWRRTQESWQLGAGQLFADRDSSIEGRFDSSKGVNVWTKWQLTLLPDTNQALSSASTNLYLVSAGAYLYVVDGQVLKYTQDITVGSPSWTSVTGNPAVTAGSVASDGNNIWTSYGVSGIYSTTRGAASQSSYVTGTVSLVGYVKGRLMAANGASIYNITAGGALPTALFTHGNSDFAWVAFTEGPGYLYAAGFSGDKSLIYKCAVRSDGTSLDPPIVAGELPDGEIVRSVQGYLGYMVIGSDKGFRCANIASSGQLTIGPLIGTTVGGPASAVKALEPNDRFVWFAWTNYDTVSTGLGRIDLSVRTTDPLTPAWASDLMATTQGTINSIASFQSRRIFSVNGIGIYAETAALVASGNLKTGLFGYGIVDAKTAIKANVRTLSLPSGSYSVALSSNEGASFVSLGTNSSVGSISFDVDCNQTVAERFELQLTLNVGNPTTQTPTVKRLMLKSDPSSALNQIISVPFLLVEKETYKDQEISMDPAFELAFISNLRQTRQIVTYQEGATQYTVVVKDYKWYPKSPTDLGQGAAWNGTLVADLKTMNG